MAMRDLPIALTFDLDSDLFDESVADTAGHSRISWRGISEGIPLIRERLARFGARATWFVRADNQIGEIYGRPAHLLDEYGDLFRALRVAGDEIAWHPHLYRREGGGWRQETDDTVLAAHMSQALADMRKAGFPVACGRIGEAFGSNGIMAAFDALEIPFASSSMPGRKRVDGERSLDWEPTPRTAYHPSITDYRVPGEPARNVLEIPFSMLKVKADYDSRAFLRYLDLSYRADAVAVGVDDLVGEAPYIVAVTHPSALLPEFRPAGGHGLVSFAIQNLEDSLAALLARAAAAGREVRFLRLADLGAELKAELDGG